MVSSGCYPALPNAVQEARTCLSALTAGAWTLAAISPVCTLAQGQIARCMAALYASQAPLGSGIQLTPQDSSDVCHAMQIMTWVVLSTACQMLSPGHWVLVRLVLGPQCGQVRHMPSLGVKCSHCYLVAAALKCQKQQLHRLN